MMHLITSRLVISGITVGISSTAPSAPAFLPELLGSCVNVPVEQPLSLDSNIVLV